MVRRLINLSKLQSFFIFGARGTGKSTLLREIFPDQSQILWIDLLKDADEETFARTPDELSHRLSAKSYQAVVIDEIQKAPKLLDIVHHEIEKNKNCRFALSGSSARKLKMTGANLLAGRAISYHLYPFTHIELAEEFDLNFTLRWGSLPKVFDLRKEADEERLLFLQTYVRTYLKEEVIAEQIVRSVEPFRDFLEIAAQSNGSIINYSKISRAIGVDDKTVKTYYDILEDTLIGFHLKPFHRSIRKRQREAPQFFFFDLGVKRALEKGLQVDLLPRSSAYGHAFEHFIILEVMRLNEYLHRDFTLSFLRTKDDAEIDLIIERPGKSDLLVEIKSTHEVREDHTRTLNQFVDSWDKECEAQVWSTDPHAKKIDKVLCLPWKEAFQKLFFDLSKTTQ